MQEIHCPEAIVDVLGAVVWWGETTWLWYITEGKGESLFLPFTQHFLRLVCLCQCLLERLNPAGGTPVWTERSPVVTSVRRDRDGERWKIAHFGASYSTMTTVEYCTVHFAETRNNKWPPVPEARRKTASTLIHDIVQHLTAAVRETYRDRDGDSQNASYSNVAPVSNDMHVDITRECRWCSHWTNVANLWLVHQGRERLAHWILWCVLVFVWQRRCIFLSVCQEYWITNLMIQTFTAPWCGHCKTFAPSYEVRFHRSFPSFLYKRAPSPWGIECLLSYTHAVIYSVGSCTNVTWTGWGSQD